VILADTSIWIEHFRKEKAGLARLVDCKAILVHPIVIGELAMGNLHPRHPTLQALHQLPTAAVATFDEVLQFVEEHRLFGIGIGYMDAHLLAAARLSGALLWTLDARFAAAAARLKIAYENPD
jgi:predicted nucleic acid-binding protein